MMKFRKLKKVFSFYIVILFVPINKDITVIKRSNFDVTDLRNVNAYTYTVEYLIHGRF